MLKRCSYIFLLVFMLVGATISQSHALWLSLSLTSAASNSKTASLEIGVAQTFIKDLGARAISTLTNQNLSEQELSTQFRKLLEEGFEVKAIGRFVLGRYWRQIKNNKEKQDVYFQLFEDELEEIYASRFRQYQGVQFHVGDARSEADSGVVVNSTLQKPGEAAVAVKWKIYQTANGPKIFDVIVEGVSLSITKRSEYANTLGNGGIEALLKALKTKTNKKSSTQPMPVNQKDNKA